MLLGEFGNGIGQAKVEHFAQRPQLAECPVFAQFADGDNPAAVDGFAAIWDDEFNIDFGGFAHAFAVWTGTVG